MAEPSAPPAYTEKPAMGQTTAQGGPSGNTYGVGAPMAGFASQPPGAYPAQPPPVGGAPYPQAPAGGYPQAPTGGYPQAPAGGYPQGPAPVHAVTTVIVTHNQGLGPRGVSTTCPNCQAQVITSTEATPGLLTWLVAGGCVFFGFWLGCCLIPFCVDDFQDVTHRCPNCHAFIGTYKRIG